MTPARGTRTSLDAELRSTLKSQYHSALGMLHTAIARCPEDRWTRRDGHANAPWRIAYHTLYYVQWYLQPDSGHLPEWSGHRRGLRLLRSKRSAGPVPYTKAEMLTYWRICDAAVDAAVDALDLRRRDSGFSWYPMTKVEHQVVALRHIQYHQAQLADRLRETTGRVVGWEGASPRPSTPRRPRSARMRAPRRGRPRAARRA